jgi:hypothetical protein
MIAGWVLIWLRLPGPYFDVPLCVNVHAFDHAIDIADVIGAFIRAIIFAA